MLSAPVSSWHKTDSDFAHARFWAERAGASSLLFFGIYVKPQNKKYFALSEGQISGRYCLSHPTRGALAIATNVRWDAVDAEVMMAIMADAYGKDVWS